MLSFIVSALVATSAFATHSSQSTLVSALTSLRVETTGASWTQVPLKTDVQPVSQT